MTAGPSTKATLDGLMKDVYGDSLDSLIPDFSKLLKLIPFKEAKKTGRDFVQSVKLTNENGFTYGAGIQTLSSAISSDVDDAKVRGNSLTLRTAFSYDAAANMAQGGKQAFIDATKYKFMAMMEASSARLEAQILYGSSGLGQSASTANVSATETDFVVSAASWAPGIWAGAEGAEIDLYNGVTKVNTAGAVTISEIDHDSKTLALTGAAGDITAIDGVGAGLDIYYRGAYGNEMVGLKTIVSNTGTLFGISGASYSLWQGNSLAVGGNLTLRKIYDGIAKAVSKGLMEDVVAVVSPATFSVLANDQASLRRYDAKYSGSKTEQGFEGVEFYGQNGKIEIMAHPMVKESEAISFPKGKCERIGATDVTFKTPGSEGGEMFKHLANETGYECRLYSEQAVFLPCPAKAVLFTGITNASS